MSIMAQQVKKLVTKTENLSSILRTYMMEGKNRVPRVVLQSLYIHVDVAYMCMYTHTHTTHIHIHTSMHTEMTR